METKEKLRNENAKPKYEELYYYSMGHLSDIQEKVTLVLQRMEEMYLVQTEQNDE